MQTLENVQTVDPDRFEMPAEIPEDGSYALRERAEAHDCYECCNGSASIDQGEEPQYTSSYVEINRMSNSNALTNGLLYASCE